MITVFRLRRFHLRLGLACLAAFSTGLALCAYGYLIGEIPLVVLILGLCVSGGMAVLSLWIVLAYFRESLTIDGQTMTQRGVLSSTTIWLPDVNDAKNRSPILLLVGVLVGLPVCFGLIGRLALGIVGDVLMGLLVAATLVLTMVLAYREDRRRKQQIAEAAPAAVEEWELGEPPCPA